MLETLITIWSSDNEIVIRLHGSCPTPCPQPSRHWCQEVRPGSQQVWFDQASAQRVSVNDCIEVDLLGQETPTVLGEVDGRERQRLEPGRPLIDLGAQQPNNRGMSRPGHARLRVRRLRNR